LLAKGDIIKTPFRIVTNPESVICLKVIDSKTNHDKDMIYVDQNTSLTIFSRRKRGGIVIEEGRLYADLGDNYYTIITPSNDRFMPSANCAFEAGLKEALLIKQRISTHKIKRKQEDDIIFENEPLWKVARYISKILAIKIGFASESLKKRRVTFYGNSKQKDLFARFEKTLSSQGLIILPQAEKSFQINMGVYFDPSKIFKGLFVRVTKGTGLLSSTTGRVRLRRNEFGFIDTNGYPVVRTLRSLNVALWCQEGYYTFIARQKLRHLPIVIKFAGRLPDGRPLFECQVKDLEFYTSVQGEPVYVSIASELAKNITYSDKEVVIPIKIRFLDQK
jgi:hypothetical protein